MSTCTYRQITETRHEWVVPAPAPHGAHITEISKAVQAASAAWYRAHGEPEADAHVMAPPDDLWAAPGEDGGEPAIIIGFTSKEEQ